MAVPGEPTVVHLRRKNGVSLVPFDVYIGRALSRGGWSLPQSQWANPYSVKAWGLERALAMYEKRVRSSPELMRDLGDLKGKALGCWCAPRPCHGDVLVRLYRERAARAPTGTAALSPGPSPVGGRPPTAADFGAIGL